MDVSTNWKKHLLRGLDLMELPHLEIDINDIRNDGSRYSIRSGYLRIREGKCEETHEEVPGVMFDYGTDGNIIGIELLHGTLGVSDCTDIEYA
ncbi:MAG: DUF2283 domain-containing protein [Patescibacteria group bacterium]|nr:DUF2283 domain-containing protein [Patescibacteria group bacterium]